MTALAAAIGLFPAAIATGIGSETQQPLARVVVGGMITEPILILLVLLAGLRHSCREESSMMRQYITLAGGAGLILGLVSTLVLAAGLPATVVLHFTDMASLSSPPRPASVEGNA